MKCLKCFLFALIFTMILFGCEKREYMDKYLSDPNKNIVELSSVLYTNDQLLNITNIDNICDIHRKFKIECVRKIGDLYRVSFLGDKSIGVLYFSPEGKKISNKLYDRNLYLNDLKKLEIGDSLSAVQKIDGNGEYLFLYTGRNIPRESTHFTLDGYVVTIIYSDENIITEFEVSLL